MSNEIVKAVDEVKQSLVKMEDQFKAALPKHIPADRFIAVAQTAIINKPELLQLDKQSLYQAFMQLAQDGLMPDGREAAIVPFKGRAKAMPMVGGICKKARNSGEISVVDSLVVYEKDEYESWVDEKGPHFRHKRALKERGKPILTYAYAIGKDGGVFFEEIDEEQMSKIQAMSKASDSPWKGPFQDEMRRKSALRRLLKHKVPSQSDLSLIFKQDDEFYQDPEEEQEKKEEQTTPTRLKNIIETQGTPVEEPKEEEKKPVKTKPEEPKSGKSATGPIENMKVTDYPNGQRRFVIKVEGLALGTFDSSIGGQFEEWMDSKKSIVVSYREVERSGKKFNDIVEVAAKEELPEEDMEGVPI